MNIVTATFSAGCTQIDADRKLWQYDQGQILQLVGLDLPDAYQVEFSNSRDKGSAKAQIGGPDGVQIPDEYLTTGKPVYAFLVGHTAEEDRETEKLVVIYVNARSQPTDEPITPEQQTIVDQLIAALTAGVAKAEDAAAQAEAAISYMPKIVDGTWWVYDAETETWADTGIQAEGQDGVGISDATMNANYTLTLTFSDGTSYTTPPIRGPKGEDAPTDYILVQPTQPTSPTNRLWVDSDRGSTVQLPTMADHQALAGAVADNTEAIGDLSDELADQKSAIEDLQDLTNRKAGALVDTASGSIASFVPDATIDNLLGVTVDIEPVQDLHGYDNPWPGGGGKNKFDPNSANHNWVGTNGVITQRDACKTCIIPIASGTSVTLSNANASSATNILLLAFFDSNDTLLSRHPLSSGSTYITVTAPENTAYVMASFFTWSEASYAQLELSSTATAYAPYSNECPISGWDSVEVEATGINIWDEEWELGGLPNGIPDSTVNKIRSKNYTLVKPSTKYFCTYGGDGGINVWFYDDEHNVLGSVSSANREFETPANASYIRFACTTGYGTTYNHDISINYPSTETTYRPYAGNHYTIALGQTVYGGTTSVAEDGTATGSKTIVKEVYDGSDDERWVLIADGTTSRRFRMVTTGFASLFSSSTFKKTSDTSNVWGTCVLASSYITLNDKNSSIANVSALRTWLSENKPEFAYELDEHITIQLDPVTTSTISGQTNNVWADAGDVSVEFAADIKDYIDRMNQPTEDDMIANTLIAANKYFTVNNRLFLSTASIAAGAMIIPGTNCQETSLAAALNAINA